VLTDPVEAGEVDLSAVARRWEPEQEIPRTYPCNNPIAHASCVILE
jgi:hypothetical protein